MSAESEESRPTFEWDSKKASSNLRKHGVSFEEAVTVFMDPLARIHDDPDHSQDEEREIIVGRSAGAKLLVVSYNEEDETISIISVRRATKLERNDYEEAT